MSGVIVDLVQRHVAARHRERNQSDAKISAPSPRNLSEAPRPIAAYLTPTTSRDSPPQSPSILPYCTPQTADPTPGLMTAMISPS